MPQCRSLSYSVMCNMYWDLDVNFHQGLSLELVSILLAVFLTALPRASAKNRPSFRVLFNLAVGVGIEISNSIVTGLGLLKSSKNYFKCIENTSQNPLHGKTISCSFEDWLLAKIVFWATLLPAEVLIFNENAFLKQQRLVMSMHKWTDLPGFLC